MEYEETWPRTPLRESSLSPTIQNIIQVKILDSGEIKNVTSTSTDNIYEEFINIVLGTVELLNPWRI